MAVPFVANKIQEHTKWPIGGTTMNVKSDLHCEVTPHPCQVWRKILWSPVINNATVEHGATNAKVIGLIRITKFIP